MRSGCGDVVYRLGTGQDQGRELGHMVSRWRHVGGESDSSRQATKWGPELGHTVFKCDLSKEKYNQPTES